MFVALAVILGLVSMLAYGLASAFSKPLAKRYGPSQTLFFRGIIISLILMAACLPSYGQLAHHWQTAWEALALGIGGYIPVLAFTHAVKVSRVGIVAPIAGASPLVTVLAAYFALHTPIHFMQWTAIAVIIVANVAVSINVRNWRSSRLFALGSGIPFAIVAAIGWGLFYYMLIYPTLTIGPWLAALFVEIGVTLAAGLHLAIRRQPLSFKTLQKPAIIGNGVLICIGTVAYTLGVHSYNQAIVITLSNSTAVVSSLVGVIVFKERFNRTEKFAGASMIAAVIILSVG